MWKMKISEAGDGRWLTTTNNHVGRQHWEFDPDAGTPEERAEVERLRQEFKKNRFSRKQSADLLMRMQLGKENPCGIIPSAIKVKEEITMEAVTTTLRRAISYYSTMQSHDGHWPAESAGPLFFLPPLVMALYVTGALNAVLTPEHQKEIIRYIYNHQNEDGGWGIHIESHSTVLGSTLSYIALRLLGEGPDDGEEGAVAKGQKWILDHGGSVGIPSWGKFWMTVLGVYEWEGCNPMPPEFLLLPILSPIHPGKMLCYFRLVYMPMSYLYGKRFQGSITPLLLSLRQELYIQPYDEINWNKARNTCAKEDLYYPHPLVQDTLWGFLYYVAEPILARWPFSYMREKALKKAIEHLHYEDENSRYLCIGCVEKVICLLACWVEDPSSEAYKRHLARIPDYFWVAEDGLKMQSFGCQTWDATFAVQAILSSNLQNEYGPTLRKAHDFIKASQVRDNPSSDFIAMYRHMSKGAWTFSIQDHGWQVSDCTAEGLKCALLFAEMPASLVGEKKETEHLYDAVNVILSLQSQNGGFPAWEPQRAFRWLEKFNSTEFLEETLIEREYVECTSSVVQGLVIFRKWHPRYREKDIESCISRATKYIEDTQEPDGSWIGRWGICYTYGIWFAVEGLVARGKTYKDSPALRKACQFLLSKQLPDGGWGESYLSASNRVYTNIQGNKSNLVQTSWALLSLIDAGQELEFVGRIQTVTTTHNLDYLHYLVELGEANYAEIDPAPINRGIKLLINSQIEDGDFPQQEITGVFMKNCSLHYSSYRNIFPIWALGQYRRRVLMA